MFYTRLTALIDLLGMAINLSLYGTRCLFRDIFHSLTAGHLLAGRFAYSAIGALLRPFPYI